jgi:hypothetical protein
MGMHMATAGRPGAFTSRVFPNGIFHIGKHLSTLIFAYERQEHLSLYCKLGETIIRPNT